MQKRKRDAALLRRLQMRALIRYLASISILTGTIIPVSALALLPQSWNGYKWSRTGPLKIRVGDNVSSVWDPYLTSAISNWNRAAIIDFQRAKGLSSPSSCAPSFGTVQACSASYGATGWLGYANVWVSSGFIVQATVRLNDYYFSQTRYNTSSWRSLVSCQEIGHTLGLAHNNTINSDLNKGSCLDYTNDPSGTKGTNGTLANAKPSASDLYNLNNIYARLDSTQLLSTKTGFRAGDGYIIEGDHLHFEISAVPEPANWALLVAGFGLVGAAIRRRTRLEQGEQRVLPSWAWGAVVAAPHALMLQS